MFDDEFSTVTFTREGTITTNLTYLVQCISHISVPENIDLKDTLFTTYPEEDPSKTSSHDPSVAPENNNKTRTLPQSKLCVQESPAIEGASIFKVINHPASEGVLKTSNLNKVCFDQQSSNRHSGVPSREGEKGWKMTKMIYLASTGRRRSTRLANKSEQKYVLFAKFSLALIVACEVARNPHIFITRENQHIQ